MSRRKGKPRPYFAQTHNCNAGEHRAKHFEVIQDAIEYVEQHGGGTVKNRDGKRYYEVFYKSEKKAKAVKL